jgi:hypothetical protein
VERRLNDLVARIACMKLCCGSRASMQDLENRLVFLQCHSVLRERLAARKPTGLLRTKQVSSSSVTRDSTVWIYPPILYTAAGGACGGKVAYHAGGSGT